MRRPAAPTKPRRAQTVSFPAAIAGWIANQNLAAPNPQAPQGARVLENILPTATGGEIRRGSALYATMPDASKPVTSLFTYSSGVINKFFAANETEIAEITTTPTNVLTGQTGGDWSVEQFVNNNGQTFLRGVNGKDTPFVYDGSTFSTTPALTFPAGVTVTPNDLLRVWAFQNRLFFIQKASMDVWYLPVTSLGGALTKFPMGGIFSRGGSLLFGSSWSIESGDGPNEYCAFFTTEGEVAVYIGSDPSDANNWVKKGVYRIGKPLGSKAWMRAGGDIVVATHIGFVPLSQAMQRDYAALSPNAISYSIETEWNDAVVSRSPGIWACEIWPERQIVVLALPTINDQPAQMWVTNTRTGAWANFTGWSGNCLETYSGRLFWGSEEGRIVEAYTTGLDEGSPYTATYVPLFTDLGTPLSLKVVAMARTVLRTAYPVNAQISIQEEYIVDLPPPPDAAPFKAGNVWGSAIWGQAVWGSDNQKQIQQDWDSASGQASAFAPGLQITSGSAVPLDTEIVRIDVTYDLADIVT